MAPTCLGKVITPCQFPVNSNWTPTGFQACVLRGQRMPFICHHLASTSRVPKGGLPHASGYQSCTELDRRSLLCVNTLQLPLWSFPLLNPPHARLQRSTPPLPSLDRQGLSSSNPRGAIKTGLILFSGSEGFPPLPIFYISWEILPGQETFCVRSLASSLTHEPYKLCLTIKSIIFAFHNTCALLSKGESKINK